MTGCPVCGAANPAATALCLGCGEPLDPRPEPGIAVATESLPPLPDGGLAGAMPDWLRPTVTGAAPGADAASPSAGAPPNPYDPATFLTAEDLPAWLRALGAKPASGARVADATGTIGAVFSVPASVARTHQDRRSGLPPASDDATIDQAPAAAGAASPAGRSVPPVQVPSVPPLAPRSRASAPIHEPAIGSITADRAAPTAPASQHPSHRTGSSRPRPRRRSGHVGAWLPALLVLVLIAAVALIVVQAMQAG